MAATVLITGSTPALQSVVDAVKAAGAEPVSASSPQELSAALENLDGSLQHFIQLPEAVQTQDATLVTTRVHEFLKQGLLSRYRTAEAVLPHLSDDARVVLVSGNINNTAGAPDDSSARLSLMHVLRHAMLADKESSAFQVRVAAPSTDPARLVAAVVEGASLTEEDEGEPLDYSDWRTELLGGMREF